MSRPIPFPRSLPWLPCGLRWPLVQAVSKSLIFDQPGPSYQHDGRCRSCAAGQDRLAGGCSSSR